MTSSRKHPGVAFWATVMVVVGLLVAYPLSMGPVFWLMDREIISEHLETTQAFYAPVLWLVHRSDTAAKIYFWYCGLWVEDREPAIEPSI